MVYILCVNDLYIVNFSFYDFGGELAITSLFNYFFLVRLLIIASYTGGEWWDASNNLAGFVTPFVFDSFLFLLRIISTKAFLILLAVIYFSYWGVG